MTEMEIESISCLIYEHPTWGCTKLYIEFYRIWNWCDHDEKPKDVFCRDMLRSLDAKETIKLLPLRSHSRKSGSRDRFQGMLRSTTEIFSNIKTVIPFMLLLSKSIPFQGQEHKSLIDQYHCLGFDNCLYFCFIEFRHI